MELIDFVFGIVKEISPITIEQHAQLRKEIEADISKVVTNPKLENGEDNPHYQPTLKAKILGFFRNPWVRLLLACGFLYTIKTIRDWYNGKFDEQNEETEE